VIQPNRSTERRQVDLSRVPDTDTEYLASVVVVAAGKPLAQICHFRQHVAGVVAHPGELGRLP
jgi:hypothetical protein